MTGSTRVLTEWAERTRGFPENRFIQEWKAQGKKVIGWVCIYVPEEIIYAAGMLPYRVSGDNEELELKQAESFLYVNTCSFARTGFQLALEGRYDFLDGLVVGETCDGARRLYDVWHRNRPLPFMHVYGIPRKFIDRSIRIYRTDLEELKGQLEHFAGREISSEDLRQAIQVYNRGRRLLRQLYELRKMSPPLLSGAEALEVVKAAMRTPRDAYNLLLERLLAEISAENNQSQSSTQIRLMVLGSILNNSHFLRGIEEVGASVVIDELCTGTRYFWGEVDETLDPMEALARYYLNRPPCARFQPYDRRFEHILQMIEEFQVHGVISEIVRYCVPYGHDKPFIKQLLSQRDIPLLELDLEYGLGQSGQVRTRVEAFIEMLKIRHGIG
ncbi:MAG: 2-hydroxyacyl-CoA dehydratase [Candidatus Tectomicrobia bacterium]|uniref:2-hydroxyacyl-CoA dehydratase n=1 Tax=Tectimicrobiota bacterium TaxID=2528274 RepID=A0A932FZC9_UNCTE|nr:2-hydroxyacyl-CoA dehydratase [Candidatus Tectomicrobia bacterium]